MLFAPPLMMPRGDWGLTLNLDYASAIELYAESSRAVTLDGVLQTALEKNPEIERAKLNLEQASGHRLVLRSTMWPDLRAGVPAGVQGGKRTGESSTRVFGFVRGFLTQPLIDATIPPSLRRGDVEVLIAQQQLNLAVEQQLHAARLAFYSALYNRALFSVREKQREHLDQNVASQDARIRAGLADRTAFTSATMQARERDECFDCFDTEDFRIGYAAFLAKRKPGFVGR